MTLSYCGEAGGDGQPEMVEGLRVLRSVKTLRAQIAEWRARGERIGLVPTMGALHDGHLALVSQAKRDCERVVTSIFVNPKQFDRADDLASYPRDEMTDLRLLVTRQADAAFIPPVEEMYPQGFSTTVAVSGLTESMEGVYRPGHFSGVATVCNKLMGQVTPDVAYFGEKDFQQLQVLRRMALDLNLPLRIAGVPTVREPDGLALSSRNRGLTPQERAVAPALHREMTSAAKALREGAEAAETLRRAGERLQAEGFRKVDYLDLRAADDLRPLGRAEGACRLFAAAWLGRVRLIDNIPV